MSAPSLIVEEGASFNGGLCMGRSEAKGGASTPLKSIAGGVVEGSEASAQDRNPSANKNGQNNKK